mgnify:CR=1 FL=1
MSNGQPQDHSNKQQALISTRGEQNTSLLQQAQDYPKEVFKESERRIDEFKDLKAAIDTDIGFVHEKMASITQKIQTNIKSE